MHYVSAEGLTKSYGIKPLFQNISFNIEEGDKIALVARNGTGKSTLLRILAGKETTDNGKLWIHKARGQSCQIQTARAQIQKGNQVHPKWIRQLLRPTRVATA